MSLLEKSQHLFNVINEQPLLEEIRKQVLKFKPSENEGIGERIYPMPLVGLLLTDPQKIDKSFSKLVSSLAEEFLSWDEEKRGILLGAANQVFQLNELCIAEFTKEFPHYTYALNPYSWFPDLIEYYKLNSNNEYKKYLFDTKQVEEIVSIFYETPAFKYALSAFSEVTDRTLLMFAEQAVVKLNEDLENAGARNKTKVFGELGEKKLNAYERHIVSLLCVRDSLSNLNQLIYQSILQEKLTAINSDNIIDYSISMTESGLGAAVKYIISSGDLWGIELFDLVVLNLDMLNTENSLFRISTRISMGDFDDTVDVEARLIDKNLNAYSGFIDKLMKNEREIS
jgi:hypothetical protein